MKFKWYKQLSLLLSVALIVTILPVYALAASDEGTKVATTIYFVEKDNQNKLSIADSFYSNPSIISENGQTYLEIEANKNFSLETIIGGSKGSLVEDKGSSQVLRYLVSNINEPFEAITEYKITPESPPSAHTVTVVVGNDILNLKAELVGKIAVAETVTPTTELTKALNEAKEINHYLTKRADMIKAYNALVIALGDEASTIPDPNTPEVKEPEESNGEGEVELTPITIDYIKRSEDTTDKKTSFNSSTVGSIGKVYSHETNGKKFIRVEILKNNISFYLTIGEDKGKLVKEIKNEDNPEITDIFVYDYEVSGFIEPIDGEFGYEARGYKRSHTLYVLVNQDATDADRTALTTTLTTAKAEAVKGAILVQAIAAAESDNNLLTRRDKIQAHISALTAATASNQSISLNTSNHYLFVDAATKNINRNDDVADLYKSLATYTQDKRYFIRITTDLETTVNEKVGTVITTPTELRDGADRVVDFELNNFADPFALTYKLGKDSVLEKLFVVINPDDTTTALAALVEQINVAKKIELKEAGLAYAFEQANEHNNLLATNSKLQQLTATLIEKIASNTDIINSLENIRANYVDLSNNTKSFDSAMVGNIIDPQTYVLNNQHYLRVKILNKYDLSFALHKDTAFNVDEGELAGTVSNGTSITHYIKDYKIENTENILPGHILLNTGRSKMQHNFNLVLNHADDIEVARTALKAAISKAELIVNKKQALADALYAAKEVNHLLTRKAVLEVRTTALVSAINANTDNNVPTPVVIHETSGLEVGKYEIPVTIYHANGSDLSTMNDYVYPIARLNVTKDTLTVYLLMTNASMVQSFSVGTKSASRTESYSSVNAARYSVQVSSLTENIPGKTHVIATVDGVELYNKTYDIFVSFGSPTKVNAWEKEDIITSTPETPVVDKEKEEVKKPEETKNPTNPTKPSVVLTDVASHWASKSIQRAVALGIVNGYADGKFKPDATINRAEFTAIIARAMKLEAKAKKVDFKDVDKIQAWATPFIEQAIEAGIINGFSDHTFRPTENVNRADMAIMIVRALNLPLVDASELTFKDADQVPAYAKAYVATAVKNGLITGFTDNTFGSAKSATRAEAITMILRALDIVKK